jgi:hypothetical protein
MLSIGVVKVFKSVFDVWTGAKLQAYVYALVSVTVAVSVCQPVYLSACLCVCFSACGRSWVSASLRVCVSVRLCVSVSLRLCVSVFVSVYSAITTRLGKLCFRLGRAGRQMFSQNVDFCNRWRVNPIRGFDLTSDV